VWGTHQCLSKREEPAELKEALRRAVAADGWLANKKLKDLVARMRTLPTLPSVYQEVIKALNSQDSSPQEIGELIAKDMAMLAKSIVLFETHDAKLAAEAYTASLFHDLGKLLMATNLPDEYNGAQSLSVKRQIPLCEIEKEIFGATHAETGAYLLALWGLGPS